MDSLLVGKSDSPCLKQDQIAVFSVQRRPPPVENIPGTANAIPG